MKKYIPLLLFAVGCVTLAPPEKRQVRNVIESKGVKADEAYNRALIHFAKSVGNSNWALQVKDESKKRIVGRLNMNCPGMQASTAIFGNNNIIYFNADFQAKDDRFRLTFDDVRWVVRDKNGNETTQGPSDDNDLKDIDDRCLKDLRESFISSVSNGKTTVDDKF